LPGAQIKENFEMHISKRLLLGDSLRVEPYATPLKVQPIDETTK
jgi:hypothetical protein